MAKKSIQCIQIEPGVKRPHLWRKYKVTARFMLEGVLSTPTWSVYAVNIFEVDKWANLLIENTAGTLTGAKKRIEKDE